MTKKTSHGIHLLSFTLVFSGDTLLLDKERTVVSVILKPIVATQERSEVNTAFFLFQLSRNPIAQFIEASGRQICTRLPELKHTPGDASLFGLALNPRNTLAAISIRILLWKN